MYIILEYKQLSKGGYIFVHSTFSVGDSYWWNLRRKSFRSRDTAVYTDWLWGFMGPQYQTENVEEWKILLIITNKIQRYTILFIAVIALHVSGGFSAHHQELKTVHTASGICQTCLLLPLAWMSSNSPMLAVAASKLDIYQMLCVHFWAPDDGRRNRLKHVDSTLYCCQCSTLYIIDSNKEFYSLLLSMLYIVEHWQQ